VLFTPHGCRVCGPVKFAGLLDFWVGPSLQIPEKTADKFVGSLNFRVGPSLQNPNKTAEKSEFQIFLGEPILQDPKKMQQNLRFEMFLGGLTSMVAYMRPSF
jgi:hypothetical protein